MTKKNTKGDIPEKNLTIKEPEAIKDLQKKFPRLKENEIIKIFEYTEGYIEEKHSYHSGPLPSPDTLSGYKKIDKTFPERIVKSFENETKHRQNMEKRIVFSGTRNETIGLLSVRVRLR